MGRVVLLEEHGHSRRLLDLRLEDRGEGKEGGGGVGGMVERRGSGMT